MSGSSEGKTEKDGMKMNPQTANTLKSCFSLGTKEEELRAVEAKQRENSAVKSVSQTKYSVTE